MTEIGTVKTGWIGFGEYDLPAEYYHADTLPPTPALSKSLGVEMVDHSPWHAWTCSERLNPNFERVDKAIFDLGSIFHKLILGKGDEIEVMAFDDWRTNAAKSARDLCRVRGHIPVLEKNMDEIEAMVAVARRQIGFNDELAYAMSGGVPERVIYWEEETDCGPIICRAMIDWLPHSGDVMPDWKSTGVGAGPDDWGKRTMWDMGADFQAAFYARGVKKVFGRDLRMIFPVVETKPPYAMGVHCPDPASLAVGQRKVQWAINAWARCLKFKRWPGYPTDTIWQEMPPWKADKWLNREMDGGVDLEALDAQIERLTAMRDVAKQDGAEVTADNAFGLNP